MGEDRGDRPRLEILGVHGIFQARQTSETLHRAWSQALNRALLSAIHNPRAFGAHDASGPLPTVAYHLATPHLAPLLYRRNNTLGDAAGANNVGDDEWIFLEAGLGDPLLDLSHAEIDRLSAAGASLGGGLPGVPPAANRMLRALDGRWPGGGRLVLGMLREVYAYLSYPDARHAIRRRLRTNAAPTTSVIIGHSLGSVIAYDALRSGDFSGQIALLTIGSPLSFPTIMRGLHQILPTRAEPSLLEGVSWTNLYDHHDPVTAGRGLQLEWQQICDYFVRNSRRNAHGAAQYLRHAEVGDFLLNSASADFR